MTTTTASEMQSPRVEKGRELLLAGLGDRYNHQTMHTVPQFWDRFGTASVASRIKSATLPTGSTTPAV